MDNLDIYNKVRIVPDNAKKTIKGGRINGFTDINPMWRIEKLTELFGPCGIGWYYDVKREWSEECGSEICAFVSIDMYIRYEGEWSKPIHGIGGSRLATMQKSGVNVSDECYKMATTDAISVACKQLGIGADVYWAEGSKYDQPGIEKPQTEKPNAQAANQAVAASKADISAMRTYFKKHGLDEKKVCQKYKAGSIEKLNAGQIAAILSEGYLEYFKQNCGVV